MKAPRTILYPALGTLALLLAAAPAAAQDDDFTGGFRIGYRSVSVDGDETKYREDINLDDGPRLFDFSFHLTPSDGALEGVVDRIDLDVDNFGGDPFESLRLNVQRYDRFQLRYTRTRSDYFYEDLLTLPANVNVRLSNGGDFHHFDFERVRDTADLSLDLSERATLTFGMNRYTRRGESTTTIDIQRDEFEFDKPIHESLNDYTVGFEYSWDRVTVVLEEAVRDFENNYEIFLPGFSIGENTTDNSTLSFYFLDQPYDLKSRDHRVRVVARPTDRWLLRGAVSVQDYESELAASERSQGTTFGGVPYTTDVTGGGEIEGDIQMLDLDATYLVSNRWAVVGSVYQRDRDQQGDFQFDGPSVGEWDVSTTGAEAGLQWSARPSLTLTGGLRWEERDVEHGAASGASEVEDFETETTEHTGWFASAGWRPSTALRITADLDTSSYDDPFTLTAPTDRLRYRVRAEYRLATAWALTGSFVGTDSDNDDSGFDASYEQVNLRVAYTTPTLEGSLGYGLVDISRNITQQASFGGVFPIDYQAESDFIDARFRWRPVESWVFGASALLYENDGSYDMTRDDLRAFVEYWFPADWSLGLAYRNVEFEENGFGFEQYDADVLEASLGYRW